MLLTNSTYFELAGDSHSNNLIIVCVVVMKFTKTWWKRNLGTPSPTPIYLTTIE
jgi:hypothetical protein